MDMEIGDRISQGKANYKVEPMYIKNEELTKNKWGKLGNSLLYNKTEKSDARK